MEIVRNEELSTKEVNCLQLNQQFEEGSKIQL